MKPRILIVEDEGPVANYLAMFLEQEGFQVDRAATLKEAETAASSHSYNLLLLDVMLPDGNADDWLPKWRKLNSEIPVLMVTGLGANDPRLRNSLNAGALGWIPKTGRVEGLLTQVRRALEL
jgi:DNA-binding response OmpR family regulator